MKHASRRLRRVSALSELEQLQGERLILHRPSEEDAAAVFAYAADPEVSRFLGWLPHNDESETRTFLRTCAEEWERGKELSWIICDEAGSVVGMVTAKLGRGMAGVGYVLAHRAWGKGYATEALQLVSAALLKHTVVSSIWAVCHLENAPSARVLEKCGFQRHGLLRNYRSCPNLGEGKRDFFSYVRQR